MSRIYRLSLPILLATALVTGCYDQPGGREKPLPNEETIPLNPDAMPDVPLEDVTPPEPEKALSLGGAEPPQPATIHPEDSPESTPATPAQPADPAALIGTSWLVGDMHVTFKTADELFVKGGMVAEVAPDGMTARYTIKEDGSLEATAMGTTMTGSWDGTTLIVGGVQAQKQ